MKVALVHDWITGMRGGEKCLETFLDLYPQADIFTLIHVPGVTRPHIDQAVVGTSFLQKLPGVHKYYRALLPLFPAAAASLDLTGYDAVISLSHAAAKNVKVDPGCIHICYCFTPMRYVWDQAQSYLGAMRYPSQPLISWLRDWDRKGSAGVTHFVGISNFVAARIRKFYGRRARVIYPAVDTSWITRTKSGEQGEAFLYAGALVPYKRVDLIVEAFNELGLPLWIAGSGMLESKLRRRAKKNVHFFGSIRDRELADCMKHSRALIFPGKEDFGMIPVECMAAGRPVIGLDAGGTAETVDGVRYWLDSGIDASDASGVFIRKADSGSVRGVVEAVRWFCKHEAEFKPERCAAQAQLFSRERFVNDWIKLALDTGFPLPETATLREISVNA